MSYSNITSTNLTKNTANFNMSTKESNTLETLAQANVKRSNDWLDKIGCLEENNNKVMTSSRSTCFIVNAYNKSSSDSNTEHFNLPIESKGGEVKNITFYCETRNNNKSPSIFRYETEPNNFRSENEIGGNIEPVYLPTFASSFSSCSLNKRRTKSIAPYIYCSDGPLKNYEEQLADKKQIFDANLNINEVEKIKEINHQILIDAPEELGIHSNNISAIKVDEDVHYIKDSQLKNNNSSLINSFMIMSNKKNKEHFNMQSCDYGFAGLNNTLKLNEKIAQSPRLTSHSKLLIDDLAVQYLSRTPQYNMNYEFIGKNFHKHEKMHDDTTYLGKSILRKSNFARNTNKKLDQAKCEEFEQFKARELVSQKNEDRHYSKDVMIYKTSSFDNMNGKFAKSIVYNQNSISGGSVDISNKLDEDSLNFYKSKNCLNFHFQEYIAYTNVDKLKSSLIQLDTIYNDFFQSNILNLAFVFNFIDSVENLELFDVSRISRPYGRTPLILAEVKRSVFFTLASIGLYIVLNHRIANKESIKNFIQSQNYNLKEAFAKLDSLFCHLILASRVMDGGNESKLNSLKYDLRKRKSIERHSCNLLSRPTQEGLLNPLNISIVSFIMKLNDNVQSLIRQIIISLKRIKQNLSKVNILAFNTIIRFFLGIKIESVSDFKEFIIDEVLYEVNLTNHKVAYDNHQNSDFLSISSVKGGKEQIKSDCVSMEIDLENMRISNIEQSKSMQLFFLPSISKKEYTLIIELEQILAFTVKSNEESYFILRPHLSYFLKLLSMHCEIVTFTLLTKERADLIIDKLDPGLISYRLYKQHTIQKDGVLSKVGLLINMI